MDCNFIKKRISAIIDDELNDKENKDVKNHLDICKECSKLIQDYKKIDAQLLLFEEIAPQNPIKIIKEKNYQVFSLFNLRKLIPVSAVLTVMIIIFISSIFITPLIYGNTDTRKQTVSDVAKSYIKCVMKPSFGYSSFIEFCNCSCEIIGKCCCNKHNKNMNCKGGNEK